MGGIFGTEGRGYSDGPSEKLHESPSGTKMDLTPDHTKPISDRKTPLQIHIYEEMVWQRREPSDHWLELKDTNKKRNTEDFKHSDQQGED